ncbi:hypothetical protein FKV24_004840 [Lysobacter maris]|uniref:Uncharacterized protein n=1 Tax=Marilutibacter maris TaxID=1605891 RepID=A0A508B4L8_9GAMM|nr:hypothetical protein [Lysobacter maris]KAB8196147.1 hypothetical protein FKV24_004840 [Lysobacter maris]
MPNVQVVDGADNCTYDIFYVEDNDFYLIFSERDQDIEFSDDFVGRVGEDKAAEVYGRMWKRRVDKKEVVGISGTLFFQLSEKKMFYPTKKESEMSIPWLNGNEE